MSRRECRHCTMRVRRNGKWGHSYQCPWYRTEIDAERRARRAAAGVCFCCKRVPPDGYRTCEKQRARVRAAKARAA